MRNVLRNVQCSAEHSTMSAAKTVADLLQRGADEAVAIAAPGRPSLTYAGLREHVASTVRRLNQLATYSRISGAGFVPGRAGEFLASGGGSLDAHSLGPEVSPGHK